MSLVELQKKFLIISDGKPDKPTQTTLKADRHQKTVLLAVW